MQAYVELKLSWSLFNKAPEALSPDERSRLARTARRQADLEERILRSSQAAAIIVPASTVDNRLVEIRQRYPSPEDYEQDLERIGLGESGVMEAIARDLRMEAVLEKVASGVPELTSTEAEIFYHLNPVSFERPEARRLRHILLTFDHPAGKQTARQTLENLRPRVWRVEDFGAAALRHSQCPTALQQGEMGLVKRGQLYPELEPGAFALGEGEISAVLESPIGLHIFRCDQIFPAGKMEFDQVRERIVEKLTDQRRRQAQREWIESLA